MSAFGTRLVIGASSLALLFGVLSGAAVAAADEGGLTATKTTTEKRQPHRNRKGPKLGSTDTCNVQCQISQLRNIIKPQLFPSRT